MSLQEDLRDGSHGLTNHLSLLGKHQTVSQMPSGYPVSEHCWFQPGPSWHYQNAKGKRCLCKRIGISLCNEVPEQYLTEFLEKTVFTCSPLPQPHSGKPTQVTSGD